MKTVLVCSSGCKREADNFQHATAMGWEVMPMSGRLRCPACRGELDRAAKYPGTPNPPETPESTKAAKEALVNVITIAGNPEETKLKRFQS